MKIHIVAAAIGAALMSFAVPAGAAPSSVAASTGAATVELVEYFLKVPTSEADPKFVPQFLAVDAQSLPKKLRRKAQSKQIEIQTLIKLHDEKKAGSFVMPLEGCTAKDFVLPLDQAALYLTLGFEEIDEDELKYVTDRTKCDEVDLGCRFSLKIFFQKKKDRRLMFNASDPIMAIVAEARSKGGSGSHLFGGGAIGCMH